MARSFECPKCGEDIGDSYQSAEPDVGIGGGYYCDACDEAFGENEPEHHEDDIQIFGTGGGSVAHCPKCLSTNLEMGFGLAGGGYGPYTYCTACCIVVTKSQDPT